MELLNSKGQIIDDLRRGVQLVAPDLKLVSQTTGFIAKSFADKTVPVIALGGAGHEPADWGYVGEGMLCASVTGMLFSPPSVAEIIRVTKQLTKQKQAFFIVKNFPADVENFTQASVCLQKEGWQVASCVVNDDISVDSELLEKERRGLAGAVLVAKILGYLAQQGANLSQLKQTSEQLVANLTTLGVAFYGSEFRVTLKKEFSLKKDEIYYGVGIHGEPGYRKERLCASELIARELVNKLRLNQRWYPQERYAVLINGLGKLTELEKLIFTADVVELLQVEGIDLPFIKVGDLFTANGLAGVSVTLLKLHESWLEALEAPVKTYAWHQ